jgi:AraC-like DNA-binding protein
VKAERIPSKSVLHSYLHENVRHGTPDFPVGFYRTATPQDFQDMPFHWHEEMEFTLVQGSLSYSIDLTTLEVEEGDLLLIPSDTLHSAHQIRDREAVTKAVVFHLSTVGLGVGDACDQRFIRPLREGRLTLPPVVRKGDPYYGELLECFHRLWECREDTLPYRELVFRAWAFRLIHLLWQCVGEAGEPLPKRISHPYEEKLKLALAYMQEHYAESITVGELADLCGFSQVHFMNVFKEAIGATCIQYLIEYRLAQAAARLQESDEPVTQIALDTGFQNISYFNRTFKTHYHVTPTAYRRKRA